MPDPRLTKALEAATEKIRHLRAERDAARSLMARSHERMLAAEEQSARDGLEIVTQRQTVVDQRKALRKLETEVKELRSELAAARRDLAAARAAAAPSTDSTATPQPADEDSTEDRFKLLEPYEADP